jgi:hypothetical protein
LPSYVCPFLLSLPHVNDLLHERGIEVNKETVRFRWNRLGPMFEVLTGFVAEFGVRAGSF